VRPTDTQRLVRALEVFEATGRPLVDWHEQSVDVDPNVQWCRFALMPDRADLHKAIDNRFAAMIQAGALEEARGFMNRHLDPALPIAKTLGLRPLIEHLAGTKTLAQAITQAQTDSRRYAKRQMTWIRTQMITWNVLFEQDSESKLSKICTFLQNIR
jgi:tRNA dimethylallyltransferase